MKERMNTVCLRMWKHPRNLPASFCLFAFRSGAKAETEDSSVPQPVAADEVSHRKYLCVVSKSRGFVPLWNLRIIPSPRALTLEEVEVKEAK